ncbi:MAG: glycoside hydrolase family protein [Thauera sp.]|jgi:GH24 family phage-related lysozyme (muramidase)|nr:glycoside hydrolase family protein [Thauera sp.]
MIRRAPVAVLSLSAAALVGLLAHEGYSDRAILPIEGDRPTVGFGSTFRDDGSAVQMGDTITPPKAVARTYAHIARDERGIKGCVTAPLTQVEYDVMVDFSYQYGVQTLCASSMVRHANAGRYVESCKSYLLYKRAAGRDCSNRANGCYGVWTRSLDRYQRCLGAQT